MNNKKIKVISSMAVVGLLTLNVFSANALVAQAKEVDDTVNATRPLGVYRSLISGENKAVAPVVVQKDTTTFADDYVTVGELVDSDKIPSITAFNGGSINRKEMVKTGDTITISGGETVTVVVYGDVNKDGLVDGDDASEILKYDVGGRTFDSIEKLAADVKNSGNNKGVVDGDDASHILKYDVGTEKAIEVEPTAEDVNENYDYTLEVVSGYINNINENAVKVNIKLNTQRTEELDNCKLVAYETGKKSTTTPIETASTFIVPAYTSEFIPTETLDLHTLTTATIADQKNITIELQDENGNVLGKTTAIKNTVSPVVINVRTERVNTLEANLSFEGFGGNEITKVYYLVTDKDTTTRTKKQVIDNNKTITVNNNKVEKAPLEGVSDYHAIHNLFYVLEDKFGNQSVVLDTGNAATTVISVEEAVKVSTVSKIEKPDLATSAAFTFKDAENNPVTGVKYFATVYKDNQIIDVIDATSTGKNNIDLADPNGDGSKNIIADNGAGTYKVSVIVKGDAQANPATIDSNPIESETITVSPLPKVSNVKIERVDGTDKLKVSWTNPSNLENISKYSVDIYKFDASQNEFVIDTTNVFTSNTNITSDKDTNNITTTTDIVAANKDTIYYAKVKSMPVSGKYQYAESEEVDSNKTYVVGTSALAINSVTTTSNTATVNITGIKPQIGNLPVSYTLKVYTVTGKDGAEEAKYSFVKDVTDITIDRTTPVNGTVEVTGLQPNTRYIFKFVEKIGDAEVPSVYAPTGTPEGILTKQIVKPVTNLTVSTNYTVDSKVGGKICVNGNEIAIDGTIYDTTDTSYPQELTDAKALVTELKDGDIVTIDNNNVTLVLNNNINERTLPAALEGKDVTIKCDTIVAKELVATASKLPKSVTLSGNSAMYTIDTTAFSSNIIIEKGVRAVDTVDGSNARVAQALKLNAGAEVIVNGVKVSTQKETTINVNATADVTVTTNKDENTLRFTNNKNINFVAEGTSNKEIQKGEIYIDTDKDVTISAATGVAVDSTINVISAAKVTSEVAKTIDLTNRGLNGTKKVTVNKDAKSIVKFYSKTDAPKDANETQLVTSSAVTLRQNYVVNDERDDLAELATAGLISAKDTDGNYISSEVTAVTNYLKSFGIDDENAKLTLEVGNKVTITFDATKGATKTVTIGNIK